MTPVLFQVLRRNGAEQGLDLDECFRPRLRSLWLVEPVQELKFPSFIGGRRGDAGDARMHLRGARGLPGLLVIVW